MGPRPTSSGLLASLRALLASILEIAQLRLDLLGTELELEKRRLFDALLLGALALLLLSLGVLALCGFALVLLWDRYRLGLVAVTSLVFLGLGCVALLLARRRLFNGAGLFAASAAELQRDQADLRGRDSGA